MGSLEIKKKTSVNFCGDRVFVTTIPKIIAELANIKKGQKILWKYDGNKITIELLKEK